MCDRIWRTIFTLVAVCLFQVPALAAEYEGFLVKLDVPPFPEAALMEALPEMEAVYPEAGLWRTEDLSAVRQCGEAGVLVYAEPNYIVTLDDPVLFSGEEAGETDSPDQPNAPQNPAASDLAEEPVGLSEKPDWETQWFTAPLELAYGEARNITGAGVRVGIVDSGIYTGHEELEDAHILPGTSYFVAEDDPRRTDTEDTYGHGTFVSGLLVAAANGYGVAGLAPEIELVPLRCFEGRSSSVANVVAGVYGGVDTYHCQVLNMSLGVTSNSAALREAVLHADAEGVIIVSAVGNLSRGSHNPAGDPFYYPAAWPEVAGVGAVTESETIASFSQRNESVWICAPGSALRSLAIEGRDAYTTGGGTSYATPLVTAAAALALSVRPDLTAQDFLALLRDTAWDLGAPGYDTTFGYGMLNIGRLLAALREDLPYQVRSVAARFARAGERPDLLLAAYNAQGQMRALWTVDGGEADSAVFDAPEAVRWQMFALSPENWRPLRKLAALYGPKADG